jgi:ketosteroid isomerase-like protein
MQKIIMNKHTIIKTWSLIIILLIISSCENKSSQNSKIFNLNSIKPIIIENGKIWGESLRTKNISLISNLYDKHAHYLPNKDKALHGINAITEYWKSSMPYLTDLQLNMESLEGTKELLYETGIGTVMVLNKTGGIDTLSYKYVNVWKLNSDGIYRVVIDVFNDNIKSN